MAVVSATRLRVRSVLFLPAFLLASGRAGRQAERSPGFRRGQLVVDRGRTFWTVTLWDDLAAMRAYRGSGAHGKAMRKIAGWCDEASTATWEQDSGALPDLEELAQRMVATARFVKLPHASRAHLAGSGPMPPRPRAVKALKPR